MCKGCIFQRHWLFLFVTNITRMLDGLKRDLLSNAGRIARFEMRID
jgi:hypothetical protein